LIVAALNLALRGCRKVILRHGNCTASFYILHLSAMFAGIFAQSVHFEVTFGVRS
jgi:hypothetical protein